MSKKITELTPAQKKQLEVYKDKWIKIGLSTKRVTLEYAQDYANRLYTQLLERKEPIGFLCESPLQAWTLTAAIYRRSQVYDKANIVEQWKNYFKENKSKIKARAFEKCKNKKYHQSQKAFDDKVKDDIKSEIKSFLEQKTEVIKEQIKKDIYS